MKEYLEKQRKLLNTLGRKKDNLESEMTNLLVEYPFLKRFMELKDSLEEINLSYEETFNDYKRAELRECKHLFVYFDERYSYGSKYYKCGCLKCGLNNFACNEEEFKAVTLEDKAIKSFLKENWYHFSRSETFFRNNTNLYFDTYEDFKNARYRYATLKKENSASSDKEIIKMMKGKMIVK